MKIKLPSIIIGLALTSTLFAQIPSTGLVGYWPFNGNANDASGNLNNGTVNGASLTTDRFGNANAAYSFNGVDNNIYIAASASINVSTEWTISCWVKVNVFPSYLSNIIWKSDGNAGMNYKAHIRVNLNKQIDGYQGCNSPQLNSNTGLLDNLKWNQITCIHTSTNQKIYLNNVLVENKLFADPGCLTKDMYIGYDPMVVNRAFNGVIDEVRVYNLALTEPEIGALYNETNTTAIVNNKQTSIGLYPNPSHDILNILNARGFTINISDISAKLVMQSKVQKDNESINISCLKGGVYFVNLNNEQSTFSHKIIKQ
jgi:hypothetical protein